MNLKEILSKYGKTQEDFARDLVMSVSTVNRWCSGKIQPSRLAKRRIKEILNEYEKKKLDFDQEEKQNTTAA